MSYNLQLSMQSVPITTNVSSNPAQAIQHYMIKFIRDLWQVGGFLRVHRFPPPIITYRHDITEILLKAAVNTKKTKPDQTVGVNMMNIKVPHYQDSFKIQKENRSKWQNRYT